MKARIFVTLKTGVLDPQGKAIEGALGSLGFDGVASVRQGKVFDIELTHSDRGKAEADLASMCERLLANTLFLSLVTLNVIFIIIGTFFRGPNWSLVSPW